MWRLLCFASCIYTNTWTHKHRFTVAVVDALRVCSICFLFDYNVCYVCVCVLAVLVGHSFYGWYLWSMQVYVLFVVPVVPLLASDNRSIIASANYGERKKKPTIIIVLKTKSFEKNETYCDTPTKNKNQIVRRHWLFCFSNAQSAWPLKTTTKWKVFHRSTIKFNKQNHTDASI